MKGWVEMAKEVKILRSIKNVGDKVRLQRDDAEQEGYLWFVSIDNMWFEYLPRVEHNSKKVYPKVRRGMLPRWVRQEELNPEFEFVQSNAEEFKYRFFVSAASWICEVTL